MAHDARHERAAMLAHLRRWRSAYPTDVFPPVSNGEGSPDRIAAHMARHVLGLLIDDIEAGRHVDDSTSGVSQR